MLLSTKDGADDDGLSSNPFMAVGNSLNADSRPTVRYISRSKNALSRWWVILSSSEVVGGLMVNHTIKIL